MNTKLRWLYGITAKRFFCVLSIDVSMEFLKQLYISHFKAATVAVIHYSTITWLGKFAQKIRWSTGSSSFHAVPPIQLSFMQHMRCTALINMMKRQILAACLPRRQKCICLCLFWMASLMNSVNLSLREQIRAEWRADGKMLGGRKRLSRKKKRYVTV